jgi:hypothetical protein
MKTSNLSQGGAIPAELHHLPTAATLLDGANIIRTPQGPTIALDQYGAVWIVQGDSLVPISDPAAEGLVSRANRRIIAVLPWAAATGVFTGVFAAVLVFLLAAYPQVQEAALYWEVQVAGGLVRIVGAVATFGILYTFGQVVFSPRTPTSPHYQPDVRGGILLVRSLHPNDHTVAARIQQAQRLMAEREGGVRAVLAILFQHPVAYFWQGDKPEKVPAFDRATGFSKVPIEYTEVTFASESWEQYNEYIEAVEPLVRNKWAVEEAQSASVNAASSTAHLYKAIATTAIALLITATAATAQKVAAQVEQYLGHERYTAAAPEGTVMFQFESIGLRRYSEGNLTFEKLLKNSPTYNDGLRTGPLQYVAIGKKILQPAATASPVPPPPATAPAHDPVRPRPLAHYAATPPPNSISIPDSAAMAERANQIKQDLSSQGAKIKATLGSVWNLIMWFFYSSLLLLLCALGFCRYIAKSAANESLISIKGRTVVGGWIVQAQQNAAGFTLILSWIIVGVLLLDIFILIVHQEWPIWLTVVAWLMILWFAERLTDWLVPNLKVAKSDHYK